MINFSPKSYLIKYCLKTLFFSFAGILLCCYSCSAQQTGQTVYTITSKTTSFKYAWSNKLGFTPRTTAPTQNEKPLYILGVTSLDVQNRQTATIVNKSTWYHKKLVTL